MRLFANQYRQYYGPQQFNYAGGANLGGAHNIAAGAGIAALTEWAGNGNVVGTSSLSVGQSAAGAGAILQRGTNALAIGNAQGTLTVAGATGGWTIAQPAAAATALSITGFGGNYVAALVASNSAGISSGLSITGPSASQLNAIVIQQTGQNSWTLLQAASSSSLVYNSNAVVHSTLTSGGGIQVGAAPTGGDQGAGTINVSGGFYVNGVAVSGGGTTILKTLQSGNSTTTSNNTTYINPTGMSLALTAGKYYQVFVSVACVDSTGAGGGVQHGLNYTGTGGTIQNGSQQSYVSNTYGGAPVVAPGSALTYANTFQQQIMGITPATMQYNMVVYGGSVGGNLVYGFHQVSSNASTATVYANSMMTAIQLN